MYLHTTLEYCPTLKIVKIMNDENDFEERKFCVEIVLKSDAKVRTQPYTYVEDVITKLCL